MNNKEFLVCVNCFTFNQASYIIDAMNGFTMQETNFSFVCTIVDDASTDGEQGVIQSYLDDFFVLDDPCITRKEETSDFFLTFAQHKVNKNCYFAVLLLKTNHYSRPDLAGRKVRYVSEWRDNSKYIAFCEGDDYWIDSQKLQKQVDYLESDYTFGLCFTRTLLKKDLTLSPEPIVESCDTLSLIAGNPIRTLTVVVRHHLYQDFLLFCEKEQLPKYDYTLFLWFSYDSRIGYLPDITGVYRVVSESVSHSRNNPRKVLAFLEKCMSVREYWIDKLSVDPTAYLYRHYVLCYKYSIANYLLDDIKHYRRELARFEQYDGLKKSKYVEFVRRIGLDIPVSFVYRLTKPVFSKFVHNHANNW